MDFALAYRDPNPGPANTVSASRVYVIQLYSLEIVSREKRKTPDLNGLRQGSHVAIPARMGAPPCETCLLDCP